MVACNSVTSLFGRIVRGRNWTVGDFLYGSLISGALYLIIPSILSLFSEKSLTDVKVSKRKDRYTTGIMNPANECYINSVLQGLSSLDALTLYLNQYLKFKKLHRDSVVPRYDLHVALSSMLSQFQELVTTNKVISNKPLVSTMEQIFQGKLSRGQNDAHEFAQLVLEKLHEEGERALRRNVDGNVLEFPFNGRTSSHYTCLGCHKSSDPKIENFLVYELNLPQVSSTTLLELLNTQQNELIEDYSCNYCQITAIIQNEKIAQNRLNDTERAILDQLVLLYPSLGMQTELPEHIIQFIKQYDKNNCNAKQIKTNIVRRTIFKKCPTILTIHLDRSMYNGSVFTKNGCRLEIPKMLELYEQDTIPNTTVPHLTRIKYQLKSVIKHTGTHYQGHYQCYRKKPRLMANTLDPRDIIDETPTIDKWSLPSSEEEPGTRDVMTPPTVGSKFKTVRSVRTHPYWLVSDHSVTECKETSVLEDGKYAYMLFYEKY